MQNRTSASCLKKFDDNLVVQLCMTQTFTGNHRSFNPPTPTPKRASLTDMDQRFNHAAHSTHQATQPAKSECTHVRTHARTQVNIMRTIVT
mmetsp:Transcript_86605/g.150772  ORF Transcript_86605/g.150772 Transcript_86605/m.150772 type:complete len:91 (-) Transcript_86605:819-1091(-)